MTSLKTSMIAASALLATLGSEARTQYRAMVEFGG
jgi:hypothetical protein